MAERYGAELADAHARGRPGRRLRRARSTLGQAAPTCRLRPAEPAAAQVAAPVGVREGRRRLRPQLRVLRHPVVPRQAAFAHRASRSSKRSTRSTRKRSCSSRKTSPATATTSTSAAPSSRSSQDVASARRARAAAVPVSIRPHRRSDRRDRRDRRSRTSTCRCSTRRRRCSSACGAGATATSSWRASTTSAPAIPDAAIRSNFIVGYPGETEADHDNLLAFMRDAQFDWVGLFAYSREEGTYADTQDGHVDAVADQGAPRRGERAARRHHAVAARARSSARRMNVLVDEPGVAAVASRGARDRRRRARARAMSPSARSRRLPSPACRAWTSRRSRVEDRVVVRLVRAGDAGERRHHHAPADQPGPAGDDRVGRRVVARGGLLDPADVDRRRRRVSRPPSRHDEFRRVPRPAGRQGAGARRAGRARVAQRPVARCRPSSSACARSRCRSTARGWRSAASACRRDGGRR